MSKGLVALTFLILIVIIVFLAFQINDNSLRCREVRLSHQDRVTKAARLLLQSATQQHDLFAHEHAQEAKLILDDIIQEHGGISLAERNLKLPKGRLDHLRNQIYDQFNQKQALVMDKIIQVHPQLDVPENEEAGLRRRKYKSSRHRDHDSKKNNHGNTPKRSQKYA
jgi:hypothetical protein